MRKYIFRVKNIPEPAAFFAGKHDGNIPKDIALSTEILEVELKDFAWDLKFTVRSFVFSCSGKKSDINELSNGNIITDKMKSLITDCKTGQNIAFKDIKATGPDGKSKDLNPIILTLN